MAPPRFGPFTLQRPIGKGGMATVWSAQHSSGEPVAVKVMNPTVGPSTTDWLAAFRDEVRAVAALDHPHVVRVYDTGLVPDDVLEPGLSPGRPWLAMERAGTTLAHHPAHGWNELRKVALALLDALGHAHARGVVHCDVKASNVLLAGVRDGPRLTDFGIARALTEPSRTGLDMAGTPSHMAPEQFEEDDQRLGPWTDLYGLGCMLWKAVCGQTPFRGGWLQLARAHYGEELPRLTPRMDVPDGLEGWLRDLLEKDPTGRFQRAADAAWRLRQLPELDAPGYSAAGPDDDTVSFTAVGFAPARDKGFRLATQPGIAPPPAPVPSDWRSHHEPAPMLGSTGLGLFGLRAAPLVGRDPACETLWRHLKQAADGTMTTVVLRGAPGTGKTRLARWLQERAHEVGGAWVLSTTHTRGGGSGDGLAPAIERLLRLGGVPFADLETKLRGALGPSLGPSLAAILRPDEASMVPGRHERHTTLRRWLRAWSRDRPIVWVIDDAQWASDAIALVTNLAAQPAAADLRVLWLVAARDDAVVAVEELATLPSSHTVALGPLPPPARGAQVRGMLGLEEPLVQQIVSRAEGNPLFAEQLVRAWVDLGVLRAGEHGYQLDRTHHDALPDDLHALWLARLDRAATRRARPRLEVAAALGRTVHAQELERAVGSIPGPPLDELVESLLAAGLAKRTQGGFRFAHGLLRDSLRRCAVEAERWQAANLACAEAVHDPERAGGYLLRAGRAADAVDLLLEGASHRGHRLGDPDGALQVLATMREAMDEAGLPASDERRGRARVLELRWWRVLGHLERALGAAAALEEDAREQGWLDLQAAAGIERAVGLHHSGRITEARSAIDAAYRLARDLDTRASAALRRALIASDAGDRAVAYRNAQEVLSYYEAQGPEGLLGAGYSRVVLAACARDEGDLQRSVELTELAAEDFRGAGDRIGQADAHNYLGEAYRRRGDLERAARAYRDALAHYEVAGAWAALLVRINLALVAWERGEVDTARSELEHVLERLDGRPQIEGASRAFLLPCLAVAGDWDAYAVTLGQAERDLGRSGFVDADVARMLDNGARLAGAAGRQQLALRTSSLAATQRMAGA